mgnify:CR=1 FL=1
MNDRRQKKAKSDQIISTSSLIGISGNLFIMFLMLSLNSCDFNVKKEDGMKKVTAAAILANPDYKAISYGGYRKDTRSTQPTIAQLKEDLKILAAIGVKVIRTYNVHMQHAVNTIEAIEELKIENRLFNIVLNCQTSNFSIYFHLFSINLFQLFSEKPLTFQRTHPIIYIINYRVSQVS